MSALHVFFAISVAFIWGCNFVAAKYGVAYYPPFLLTAIRFTAVSVILLPFVPRPSWAQFKRIMLISTMSSLHFSLIFVALAWELDIPSSTLIGQLGVPFACLLGVVFLGDRLGLWRISGIIIAFAGTLIVSGTPNIAAHLPGFYAALASTLTWGVANVLVKRVSELNPMSLLAWMGACTVPTLFTLAYLFEPTWPDLFHPPLSAFAGVSFTIICSTILAYGLWYFLLSRYDVSQVAPFSLMTPIFGIMAGQLFFHEDLTWQVIVGGLVTLVGVAIIVLRRPKTIPLGEAT